jgi:hypothetical protein
MTLAMRDFVDVKTFPQATRAASLCIGEFFSISRYLFRPRSSAGSQSSQSPMTASNDLQQVNGLQSDERIAFYPKMLDMSELFGSICFSSENRVVVSFAKGGHRRESGICILLNDLCGGGRGTTNELLFLLRVRSARINSFGMSSDWVSLQTRMLCTEPWNGFLL